MNLSEIIDWLVMAFEWFTTVMFVLLVLAIAGLAFVVFWLNYAGH